MRSRSAGPCRRCHCREHTPRGRRSGPAGSRPPASAVRVPVSRSQRGALQSAWTSSVRLSRLPVQRVVPVTAATPGRIPPHSGPNVTPGSRPSRSRSKLGFDPSCTRLRRRPTDHGRAVQGPAWSVRCARSPRFRASPRRPALPAPSVQIPESGVHRHAGFL